MKYKFGKKGNKRSSDDFLTKLLTIVLPIAFQQFMLALVSASGLLMCIFTNEAVLIDGGATYL